MTQFECVVGLLKERLSLPTSPLEVFGKSISAYFTEHSSIEDLDPAIELRVQVDSRLRSCEISDAKKTDTFYLQKALRKLVGRQTRPGPAKRIGLIYADRLHHHPGVLGLMFDFGFNPSGLRATTSRYTSVPREGCAVFLDAIRALRGDGHDYQQEAMFTTLHELGHVFNLWHTDTPDSLMSSSKSSSVYPQEAFAFHERHQQFLARCSESEFVWPGGSRFGTRGTLGPSTGLSGVNQATNPELELEISVSQGEFWNFEPIELDLSIRVARGKQTIPDTVDPSYDVFAIWIEQPDGTRIRYPSPKRICSNLDWIQIHPDQPFERDISLFAASGGYTFIMPGPHKVQVTLALPTGTTLFSNEITCVVKEDSESWDCRQMRMFLTDERIARILYTRRAHPWKKILAQLAEFSDWCPNADLACNVRYALLRLLESAASGRSRQTRDRYMNESRALTQQVLEYSKLSPGRKRHCERILSDAS